MIRPWYLKKWFLRIIGGFALLVIGFGIFVWYAYRAAQVVPEYYQTILQQPSEELDQAGDEFETEMLELQNNAIKMGNGKPYLLKIKSMAGCRLTYLKKFPDSLPESISEPRVSLEDDEFRIIFRYDQNDLLASWKQAATFFARLN